MSAIQNTTAVRAFILQPRVVGAETELPAISLFSGAGFSDLGYELSGFDIIAQVEKHAGRAALCSDNFPNSGVIIGEVKDTWQLVVQKYREQHSAEQLTLMSITPPCQGMSSSNPGRGHSANAETSDERNLLLIDALPIIKELVPRIVVVENVPELFGRVVRVDGIQEPLRLVEAFRAGLSNYHLFSSVVEMADYGIPQNRQRAVLVAIRRDEPCVNRLLLAKRLPIPKPTHRELPENGFFKWITLEEWFTLCNYPVLDARSPESTHDANDPLHFVLSYDEDRYVMVSDIPSRSGRNAYQNSRCHICNRDDVPEGLAYCPTCNSPMRNRPYVIEEDGTYRLIKGFKSSYRRMPHDRPARTITTSSSHIGSDYKIHPWENRILSIRECADLQTIPRFYNWQWALKTRHIYQMRQVIGEALPPFFTYLHGRVLQDLLNDNVNPAILISSTES